MTAFKDLRGRHTREVDHTDAVVIAGEEYIRKSEAADSLERLRTEIDSAVLHRISEFAREHRDYGNKAVSDYLGLTVGLVKATRERLRAGGFDV